MDVTNTIGLLYVDHIGTRIDPRNHVPVMPIIEFLQEIAKNFNLQYNIDLRNMTVEVRQIANADAYGPIVDLSGITAPEPTLQFDEQSYSHGYEFSFEATGGATLKDIADFRMRGQHYTPAGLPAIPSPLKDDVAYVLNMNAYYQYDGFAWVFLCDNVGPYATATSDSVQKLSSKCYPPRMDAEPVELFAVTGLGIVKYSTGSKQVNPFTNIGVCGRGIFTFDFSKLGATGGDAQRLASCFYLDDVPQITHNPCIANFHGMRPQASTAVNYPMLSPMVRDVFGTPLATAYDLVWHTYSDTGLHERFWRTLIRQLSNTIEADFEVQLDSVLLNNIDWNGRLFKVDDLLYLCRKARLVLPTPSVATLTLVRV